MKKFTIRVGALAASGAMALTALTGGAAIAVEGYTPTTPVPTTKRYAEQVAYPGTFNAMPGKLDPSKSGAGSAFEPVVTSVSSDAAAAEGAGDSSTVGGTGGGLALTGSEVALPAAVGAGLLATGGALVIAARRREQ